MGAPGGTPSPKDVLQRYLQRAREALVWKLEGLAPYDQRRPLVGSGTNLLGLLKHCAMVDAGYLGEVFGRPFPEPMPWAGPDVEPDTDMWATADESAEELVALYRRVWAHGDETVASLELGATGHVPWWGEHGEVTLQQILVHLTAETHRHAGHADVLRELVDGAVGQRPGDGYHSGRDAAAAAAHRDRLEQVARTATS